jgi:glycosyltransferase involved in cell wall biosynthesis
MRIDFCLPIKNEEDIIENSFLSLFDYLKSANYDFDWKIIGIINNSSDDSENICKRLKENFPEEIDFLVIEKVGKGGAIKNYWQQSEADILAFMDADLAVALDNISSLIEPIINKDADLVIGSRFLKDSKVERSLKRKLISYLYVTISQIIIPHHTRDLQCGFKAISKPGFKKVEKFLFDDYWFFDTELVIAAEQNSLSVLEIGVSWQEKRQNAKKSKVRIIRDGYSFIKNLFAFRKRLAKIKNQDFL